MTRITKAIDAAYTTIALASTADNHGRFTAQSPWDPVQMRALQEDYDFDGIPGLKAAVVGDIDTPVTTLSHMSEAELQQTPFFQNWAKPQGLREACITKFVHTADRIGLMGCTTRASRGTISVEDQRFLALLSPHMRRAFPDWRSARSGPRYRQSLSRGARLPGCAYCSYWLQRSNPPCECGCRSDVFRARSYPFQERPAPGAEPGSSPRSAGSHRQCRGRGCFTWLPRHRPACFRPWSTARRRVCFAVDRRNRARGFSARMRRRLRVDHDVLFPTPGGRSHNAIRPYSRRGARPPADR